jgi:Fibronectin type III domain/F5/8 type C domain
LKLLRLLAICVGAITLFACSSEPPAGRPPTDSDASVNDSGPDTSTTGPETAPPADAGPVLSAPKDPSGLVLEIVSETSVKLVWNNNADNADSFEVRWAPNDIVPSAANATVPATMLTYLATGLTSGQPYHFWVRAVNHAGASNDIMGVITPVPVPLQPQRVTADPGPSGTVTLSWDDVTDEIGYNVYWSAETTKPATPNMKLATDTISFAATNLMPCTTYHFWVEAFNERAAGEAGQTTSKAETAPADPSALAIQVAGTTATVTWKDNADNESDYTVYWAKGTGAAQPAAGTSAFAKAGVGGTATFVISNLSAGSAYTVWVEAKNCIATSAAISGPANTIPLPLAPTGFTATITGAASDTLHLSWTNRATDAKGYRVYYSTTAIIPATPGVDNLPVDATSTDITGLMPLTTYHFWIVAFNDSGESNPALTGQAAIGKPPDSPAGLTVDAVASKFKIVVSWTGGDAAAQSYKLNWTVDGVTANVDPIALAGDQTSYTLAEVYANSSYVFSLQATNVVGDSAPAVSSPVSSFQIPGHGPSQINAIREAWIEASGFLHFAWWVGNGVADAGNGMDAVGATSYAAYWSNSTTRPAAGFPNNQTLGATYYFWTSQGFNVPYPRYLWAEGKGPDGSLFWFYKLVPGPDMTGVITFSNIADGAITLSWPAMAGANGYRVWKSISATHPTDNGSAALVTTGTTYNATGLDSGTTYYFWVEATGPALNNGPSFAGMSGAPISGNATTTGIVYTLISGGALATSHNTTFGITASHPTEVIPGAPIFVWADSRAFDANTGTLWGYTDGSFTTAITAGQIDQFGSPPNPPWVAVDLGQAQVIALVRLTWEGAFTRVYKLQASNDQTTWDTLIDVQCDTGGACPVANQFHTVADVAQKFLITNTTPYRYVRLLIPSPNATDYVNTNWGVKIRDIGIYKGP